MNHEVIMAEIFYSRTFNYTIKDDTLQVIHDQDTTLFNAEKTKDSLFLELIEARESPYKKFFELFEHKWFVRLSSWDGLTKWDSLLVERHYWVNQEKNAIAERIILTPDGKTGVQTALKENLKGGKHVCSVRDSVRAALALEISRITPHTFYLLNGPVEDALLYNTITVFSPAGTYSFSGFDVPRAYPVLKNLLDRLPEVLACD